MEDVFFNHSDGKRRSHWLLMFVRSRVDIQHNKINNVCLKGKHWHTFPLLLLILHSATISASLSSTRARCCNSWTSFLGWWPVFWLSPSCSTTNTGGSLVQNTWKASHFSAQKHGEKISYYMDRILTPWWLDLRAANTIKTMMKTH